MKKRTGPARQQISKCASCLYRIGFGYNTIGKILGQHKSRICKWIKIDKIPGPALTRSGKSTCEGKGKRRLDENRFRGNLRRCLSISKKMFPNIKRKKLNLTRQEFILRQRATSKRTYERRKSEPGYISSRAALAIA